MKTIFAAIAAFFGFFFVIFLIGWMVEGNNFFMYKFFAPKREAVRREVFEQTKSYNQGMIQELDNMRMEYIQADTNHQTAMASIILHRAADYDMTILKQKNPDLYQFIENLKNPQSQHSY